MVQGVAAARAGAGEISAHSLGASAHCPIWNALLRTFSRYREGIVRFNRHPDSNDCIHDTIRMVSGRSSGLGASGHLDRHGFGRSSLHPDCIWLGTSVPEKAANCLRD